MSQPAPADGVGHDGALVADDRIVEARLQGVRPHRLEHAARDEHDVNPGRTRRRERGTRARAQHGVFADQRPVEIARNRIDRAREVVRELQPCGVVRKSTRSFRSLADNDPYDFGMTLCG